MINIKAPITFFSFGKIFPAILFLFLIAQKCEARFVSLKSAKSDSVFISQENLPAALKIFLNVYSNFLDSSGGNNIYWKDGTVMVYDDGYEKSHEEKLDDPDIEDMLSQKYVSGENWDNPPKENFEPGRIRFEPFFRKMYGDNSDMVRENLTELRWVDGSQIIFNKVNGASDSLQKVIDELEQLPQEFQKYLKNPGGTFVWRNIAGTNRLSNHSFGTAIDINTKFSDYWQWNKNLKYVNRIPFDIVEIFERYGFIWGGKWYHYDTMHFEFRPELTSD